MDARASAGAPPTGSPSPPSHGDCWSTRGLALARGAARFDQRVVDAPARGVGRLGRTLAGGLARGDTRLVDAGVRAVAATGSWLAALGARFGEFGIDAAVRGVVGTIAAAGRDSRRLQSGLVHHYLVIAARGTVLLAAVAAAWR